ncbi:MAG: hypothetical protein ABSE05_16635 [Syntrophales bacterium]|jgi:hypothetical protein
MKKTIFVILAGFFLVILPYGFLSADEYSGLTSCQRQMLIYAKQLGSDELIAKAKDRNLTCSHREALINEERIKRGLEPIRFNY